MRNGLKKSGSGVADANKCADALARRGVLMDQDFTIFLIPPPDVVFLLSLDTVGSLFDRFVASGLEAV